MTIDPKRVKEIFLDAAELPDEAVRTAYLAKACGSDTGLRARVEALLRSHDPEGTFLGTPAAVVPDPDESATHDFAPALDEAAAQTSDVWAGASDDEPLSFLAPPTRPNALGRIGHYEVLQVLGRGAYGIVFRAFDEMLQRVVALKVMAPQLAATSPARKRFLREARSSAQVRHENVVQVYEVAEQPLPYLVMEFIPGETLQQKLDRIGPLEAPEVLRIGRQLAEGLAAAHATGLIHRDIKPANILLEAGPQQRVKITDFGMARTADDASLSQSGVLAGTPMYMAPEQAEGETLDHRADLFSLGSVLYVMAAGRPPFRSSTIAGVLKRVAEKEPRPIREVVPEIPQHLCEIIARLHAKKPEDRFATAREVADLLGRCLAEIQPRRSGVRGQGAERTTASDSSLTPDPWPLTPGGRRFRSRRWAAAAAVLLMLLGGLGFTEATGVTDFRGTVIRLFSPEGTLVVEVDDAGVSVNIDGSEIVITGAGTREIRLKPGSYTVEASKGGKLVRRELVTVTNNGKQVVRVSQEATPAATKAAKGADVAAWERAVAGLSADEQAMFVSARMRKLNPNFDDALTPTIEHGVVTGVDINIDRVIDISPIRALTGLTSLTCQVSDGVRSRLLDLSPLKELPLTRLNCIDCNVCDLTPLKGMKLRYLHLGSTLVYDLSPLAGMPLEDLDFSFTKVSDISPLEGMKLTSIGFEATEVSDLTPLKGMALTHLAIGRKTTDLTPLTGMPLELLTCHESRISDLSPLKGMSLKLLNCGGTLVSDLSPVKGMPLNHLGLDGTKVSDLAPLRGMKLIDLGIPYTNVSDLSPLVGMPLERLQCQGSKVTDLSPVKDLPLTWFVCDFRPERDAKILRTMPALKTINYKPAAEFWEGHDREKFK